MSGLEIDLIYTIVVAELAFGLRYLLYYYYDITLYELVYYLKMPLKGANAGPFTKEIPGVLLTALLTGGIVFGVDRYLGENHLFVIIDSLVLAIMVLYFVYHMSLARFIYRICSVTDLYEKHYVEPTKETFSFPTKKRNLIYIFMESMESAYSIRQNKKVDYIKELTELSENGASFGGEELGGAYVTPGATFTTGAMVAQLAGVPIHLCIPRTGRRTKDFLPGISMMGDILKEEGYRTEFILGSDVVFGGRRPLMESHGWSRILDYQKAKEEKRIPEDYFEFWGYEDEKLYAHAREELQALAEREEPFAVSLLTVDTHFIDGYTCRNCGHDFQDSFANVLACASKQVADFVEWCKQQPFYENTTIVLVGDHPTMDYAFIRRAGLTKEERRSFVSYLNVPEHLQEQEHIYTTLDLFPTTLAALGVTLSRNRLGLGSNLFSDEKTLLELYGEKKLQKMTMNRSLLYKKEFVKKQTRRRCR